MLLLTKQLSDYERASVFFYAFFTCFIIQISVVEGNKRTNNFKVGQFSFVLDSYKNCYWGKLFIHQDDSKGAFDLAKLKDGWWDDKFVKTALCKLREFAS